MKHYYTTKRLQAEAQRRERVWRRKQFVREWSKPAAIALTLILVAAYAYWIIATLAERTI